jgi:type III pantothenate kinase
MKICVDIGNTYVKSAVYKESDLSDFIRFKLNELSVFESFINNYAPFQSAIISSVRETPEELFHLLDDVPKVIQLDHNTSLPFDIQYDTPETLGRDRIAGLATAWKQFPAKNVLVIDMGTCITYDLLQSNGLYQGGLISPGIHMRFKAMHQFTGKLPLLEPDREAKLIGTSTYGSMQAGVLYGVRGEMESIIDSFRANYEELTVLIGGGDNIYFDDKFSFSIFAAPNLVLDGLKVILDFNDKQ